MRQPLRTRQSVLEAGFWEIYRQGFRAARIEAILKGTGVTKGALYHHFPTKAALGQAVLGEIIRPMIHDRWIGPVERAGHPIDGMADAVTARERDDPPELLMGGCPLFNLLQDVGDADDELQTSARRVLDEWRATLARDIARGQAAGQVKADLHPETTAGFLIAAYHGVAGTAKAARAQPAARRLLRTYRTLIETLRA